MISEALPGYTQADVKERLLAMGASGTVYALVMPEGERALARVMDGCDRDAQIVGASGSSGTDLERLDDIREAAVLSRYREPWTQKQDAMHVEYFDRWIEWSRPVVSFDVAAFPHRYPTAGASEGIFKLMAEYAAAPRSWRGEPSIAMFQGEYEGFPAFAESLNLPVARLDRGDWRGAIAGLPAGAQFWISQPSAIDGMVWEDFDDFAATLAAVRPDVQLVPDLSYVGAVAREYRIDLDHPNIDAFVISHSKPLGGYYHRCGGVFARDERRSLFGNRWFKNLLTLAWGCEMMRRHDVFDLPRRYRGQQEAAAVAIGRRLGVAIRPADVFVIGIADAPDDPDPLVRTLLRGSPRERRVRVCLTPAMSALVGPAYAPGIQAPDLGAVS